MTDYVFVASDLSQIEARVLPWLAKDQDTLDLVAKGMNIYQVHAVTSMNWTGGNIQEENAPLYGLAKARTLALGFQAGHERFLDMARIYIKPAEYALIFGAPVSEDQVTKYLDYREWLSGKLGHNFEEWLAGWKNLKEQKRRFLINSKAQVDDYRATNPKIADPKTGLWARLDKAAKNACDAPDRELVIELPSGNNITYRGLKKTNDRVSATIVRRGSFSKGGLYGGLLAENVTQSLARDIFVYHLVRAEQELGLDLCLHTHDEIVARVPRVDAEGVKTKLEALMSEAPPWIPTLPVGCKAEILEFYKK